MHMNRRTFLKGLAKATAGSGLVLLAAYEYSAHVELESLGLERVQIPIKNLPSGLDGLRIVQISDLHLYPYTQLELIQEAVTLANALQPDLIVLTGDYVLQRADAIFDLVPVLTSLNARYGVFTILGNHDLWTDERVVTAGLAEARLPLLRNEGLTLAIGKERLFLAGVDDGWSGQPDLQAALAKLPSDVSALLLAHEPDLADVFAPDGRVMLQLSGHSHGGQFRVPGLGAPFLPHLAKKYDQGLFRVGEMWLYTNRGIGVVLPFRINCPPEVTEITLVAR